jgi:UDP-GlcNAc3NAcA epimerase
MKIMTVIGARPQFIKAAAVSKAFTNSNRLHEFIVHTGQHHDSNMSDIFFTELEIPLPKYNLNIFGGGHGDMTGRMLAGLETLCLEEKPDVVLVYGDTNSTLAGALAASKLHIPLAHVEAGLRSFNKKMPEEVNRILTDHVSDYLFTPTVTADLNLQKEGFDQAKIHNVGDVMFDAAVYFGQKADRKSDIIRRLGITPKAYVLSTVHRAENTDVPQRLESIFKALMAVSQRLPVVLPLHPRTRQTLVQKFKFDFSKYPNLKIIEPVGYLDMVSLEKNAQLIATDSGGVQKEAFFYRVPCVTLRDQTEWTELIELGWNTLVSPRNSEEVETVISESLKKEGRAGAPYGEGRSSEKIADVLSRI